ncbi:SDR family oxidoreductase [Aquipseudomonas alcaligenes]|uniref:NADP-dependent 3-hydroxy acid dehydrogenase YdfG n=1 Tax=Aquipseudomonas alcaligenes TaxID=43263 RepID=A0A1N6SMM3_AQUAC|nr:SDR family oxidoreductase [Pseudomonas alcaligenes]SIQ42216.1 NADP-dependent 3-hydroxy acid dehydrogenase YdfG [Pseudomonas alcaligenes]
MNTILITGAASGIGAATARLFHARGWAVGLLDIDQPALAALAAELGGAWHAALDVADADAVHAALEQFCRREGGRLRVLFNSAGVLRFGYFEEITLEEHARILQINVLGLLHVTHAAFPYLKGTPGAQVINMGSASGLYGTPHMVSYSASKFAVRGLTEALELEWRRHGIRVGDLMPPFVATPMVDSQRFTPPALRRLGVNLRAEDIALAVWRQVERPRVHRPIHWLFRLMYAAGQVSPPSVSRLLMGWLSRG